MKKMVLLASLWAYALPIVCSHNLKPRSWADVVKGKPRQQHMPNAEKIVSIPPVQHIAVPPYVPIAVPQDVLDFDVACAFMMMPDQNAQRVGKELFGKVIANEHADPFLKLLSRINSASYNLYQGGEPDQTIETLLPLLNLQGIPGLSLWQIRACELMAGAYGAKDEREKRLTSLCNALGIAYNNDHFMHTNGASEFPLHAPATITALISLLRESDLDSQFSAWLLTGLSTKKQIDDFDATLFALADEYGSADTFLVQVKRALLQREYERAFSLCEKASLDERCLPDLALIKAYWQAVSSDNEHRPKGLYGLSLCEASPQRAEMYLSLAAGLGLQTAQQKLYALTQSETDLEKMR